MLKVIYVFFLGLLLSIAVGVGVSAFYQQPEAPKYPGFSSSDTQEQRDDKQASYDKQLTEHTEKLNTYNRNVSLIVLGFAVTFLVVSMAIYSKADVVSDGLLLGGLISLIYSVIRGFNADDERYTFVLVVVGIIIALVLGYYKFIKPQNKKPKKTKSK
jgi:predicted histidine transporter YuiF (NhaC family)